MDWKLRPPRRCFKYDGLTDPFNRLAAVRIQHASNLSCLHLQVSQIAATNASGAQRRRFQCGGHYDPSSEGNYHTKTRDRLMTTDWKLRLPRRCFKYDGLTDPFNSSAAVRIQHASNLSCLHLQVSQIAATNASAAQRRRFQCGGHYDPSSEGNYHTKTRDRLMTTDWKLRLPRRCFKYDGLTDPFNSSAAVRIQHASNLSCLHLQVSQIAATNASGAQRRRFQCGGHYDPSSEGNYHTKTRDRLMTTDWKLRLPRRCFKYDGLTDPFNSSAAVRIQHASNLSCLHLQVSQIAATNASGAQRRRFQCGGHYDPSSEGNYHTKTRDRLMTTDWKLRLPRRCFKYDGLTDPFNSISDSSDQRIWSAEASFSMWWPLRPKQ
ncbi:hypothetical protein MRX96_037855 [Rhipicephalus microplus]